MGERKPHDKQPEQIKYVLWKKDGNVGFAAAFKKKVVPKKSI